MDDRGITCRGISTVIKGGDAAGKRVKAALAAFKASIKRGGPKNREPRLAGTLCVDSAVEKPIEQNAHVRAI